VHQIAASLLTLSVMAKGFEEACTVLLGTTTEDHVRDRTSKRQCSWQQSQGLLQRNWLLMPVTLD